MRTIAMPRAFILINTDLHVYDDILNTLRKVEGVKEVYKLHGVYDIIAKVEADSMEKFKEIVNRKLRSAREIKSTITMIVSEDTRI